MCATQKRLKFQCELIRVLLEDELDAVQKVFGVSFGIVVMQSVPSVKSLRLNPMLTAMIWMRNSDPVRMVSFSNDDVGCTQYIEKGFVCQWCTRTKTVYTKCTSLKQQTFPAGTKN
jgi:hypothetical protein